MKIIIIGKTGQLGEELVKQSSSKHNVMAFSHDELPIEDSERVSDVIKNEKPDLFINTSAFHVVPLCETEPDKAFLINAICLKTIVQSCLENKVKFVTVSTDYVFDGLTGRPNNEDDLTNPVQIYGISKLAGENITLAYNPESVVIRTCGVYGGKSGSKSKKGNFALSIIKEAKEKEKIEVASEQIVNPTYAKDLAKAILELTEKNDISGIYHLANEGFCSWADFAKEVVKYKGLKSEIVPVDRKGLAGDLRRPIFSALANNRAKDLRVVLPSWQDAIKRYLESFNDE